MTKALYQSISIDDDGNMIGQHLKYSSPMQFQSSLLMEWIYNGFHEVSDEAAEEIYALSDGYGERGFIPSQGYDWSGIRDSSDEAKRDMFWAAVEHLPPARFAAVLGMNEADLRAAMQRAYGA